MKILHTSDWHIGKKIYGQKRVREFEGLFRWLTKIIDDEKIEALIVSGDVFDARTPTPQDQALYYDFLSGLAGGPCRHVVVVAGNHDSPALLAAPREFLKRSHIHIVGEAGTAEDEVLLLRNPAGRPELLVGAVPYLRESDLRRVEFGQDEAAREAQLIEGLRAHFAAVTARALEWRAGAAGDPPLVVTGHLFVQGGRRDEDEGDRPLYLGGQGLAPADIFPETIDYLALGHLHSPQTVGGRDHCRYSGAPLPMKFGDRPKSVVVVEARPGRVETALIEAPVFRPLVRIKGDLARIKEAVAAVTDGEAWLEVTYEGAEPLEDLRRELGERGPAVLCLKNRHLEQLALSGAGENLRTRTPEEVFERRLAAPDVPEALKPGLREDFAALLFRLREEDGA